tara:strand:- start:1858 stop:2460 length:603 start_codon:yes stop_codon:yes gene_type:complete
MTVFAPFLVAVFNISPPTPQFDRHHLLPSIAVENCRHTKNASNYKKQRALRIAKILYEVEADLKIPDKMRGMILSAACIESGFNPNALGDRKFSKKKKPMAVGVLQMWRFYERAYGTNRKDPKSSAIGWLTHIKRMVPKVKRKCKYRSVRRVWVAAWVTGIRYPKPEGRCKERPKHYKFFLKIRRIYEVKTKASLTKSGK